MNERPAAERPTSDQADGAGSGDGRASEGPGDRSRDGGAGAGGVGAGDVASSDALPAGERPPLAALLEAVLLVTDEPVPAATLAAVSGSPVEDVESTLDTIASGFSAQGRGFELRLVAGGWRLYTRADCAPYVERFLLDGQSARLTQAALETLAVIAYRQPVTRSRVSAVRGVNVDGVVRTLQARGLITDAGQDADSAGTLFRTTPLFLERLGLRSLDELPPLAPLLPELDELDDASTST